MDFYEKAKSLMCEAGLIYVSGLLITKNFRVILTPESGVYKTDFEALFNLN